jgi:uncharacterized repeat protein (TIGR01451 family)
MRKTIISLAITAAIITSPGSAYAQSSPLCQPIYGGGTTCEQPSGLTLIKQVQNPQTGQYGTANPIYTMFFAPGQTVPFKIKLTNTYDTALTNIMIQDQFPPYVDYISGNGSFNQKTGVLTTSIPSLAAHQTVSLYIQGKITDASQLPTNQTNICVANQATATANNLTSVANSQFCISKDILNNTSSSTAQPSNPPTSAGGLPVYPPQVQSKTTPSTGPESWAIAALLPLGLAGIYLRRKTKLRSTS